MRSLDSAMGEVERLRTNLRKGRNRQIRTLDERALMAATARAWFNSHKPAALAGSSAVDVSAIDALYKEVLEASAKNATRELVVDVLKQLKAELVRARSEITIRTSSAMGAPPVSTMPDFSRLSSDSAMCEILRRRWVETERCVSADAPLAATVMMGGLLEALLLARINQLADKGPVFKAKSAPRDPKTQKVRPLQEWGLKNFIDVANELGWISKPAKDVGEVLRDYRNYVHPYKEYSHGASVTKHDAELYWSIASMMARQLVPT